MTENNKEGYCKCEEGPQFETSRTADGDIQDDSDAVKYCCRCEKTIKQKKSPAVVLMRQRDH